jgi:hypothetical protein
VTKQLLACPVCGHSRASMTQSGDRYLLGCWSCEADGLGGGDWLRAVAEAVGAPGGGALLDDPERWLAPYFNSTTRRGKPAELPSLAKIDGWHKALLSNAAAFSYLRHDRRLSLRAINECQLGYAEHGVAGAYHDWPAFTLPVFAAPGEPINLRKRLWPEAPRDAGGKPVKYVGLSGRGSSLYPNLPPACPGLRGLDALLVAGEFDALVARQQRLPAVSTTCGARLPEALVKPLAAAYRRIAVLFDVGEEQAAARVVEALRAAGTTAWTVDLPFTVKGADLSDFFAVGATRDELLDLIKQARR